MPAPFGPAMIMTFLSGIQIRPYLPSARGRAVLLSLGVGCVGVRHFDVTALLEGLLGGLLGGAYGFENRISGVMQ